MNKSIKIRLIWMKLQL